MYQSKHHGYNFFIQIARIVFLVIRSYKQHFLHYSLLCSNFVSDDSIQFVAQIAEKNYSFVYYEDRVEFEDALEQCDSIGSQLFLSEDPETRIAVCV